MIVLMKIIIISWNVRGLIDARKRQLIKSLLHTWKADVYCFRETKLQGDIRNIVRELWANRWVKYAQLEASGTIGGILILWAGRVWEGGNMRGRGLLHHLQIHGKNIGFQLAYVWSICAKRQRRERRGLVGTSIGERAFLKSLGGGG